MFNSPAFTRRQLRVLLALTFLAWATQTFLAAYVKADDGNVAPRTPISRPVALELRGDATVAGAEIRFAQIARWADADADVLAPLADLIVLRFDDKVAIRKVTLDELRTLLKDAGVNVAPLNFNGPRACTVNRSDVTYDAGAALQQWGDAVGENPVHDAAGAKPRAASAAPLAAARDNDKSDDDEPRAHVADNPNRSLRDLLIASLAERTKVPVESLQLTFRKEDESVLKLVEPHFSFEIEPQRAGNLGDVSWNVTIRPTGDDNDAKSRVFVKAGARAWQRQVVTAGPLAAKQVIRDEDVVDRRVLVDRLDDARPIGRDQVVGRQASRELREGVVMTEKLVDLAQLVRSGQLVTITLSRNGVSVTTVARAVDGGTLGQSIRVKGENSKETFRVQVTGPQEAAVGQPKTP